MIMNFFENFSITDTIMSFIRCLKDLVPKSKSAEEEDNIIYSKYNKIIAELPRADTTDYCNYKGVWLREKRCKGVMAAQEHFKSLPGDILLASFPEPGTTWLKTLIFSIVHRQTHLTSSSSSCNDHHPIRHGNPDELILDLEDLYLGKDEICELDANIPPQPRLFVTNMPCTILPNSIIESGSRIVYVSRNPQNTFVAQWRYSNRIASMIYAPAPELENCFEKYIKGESEFGPHWDHVLGYWKKYLEYPERVLFIKYEQLLDDPVSHVKRLAAFLDYPFSEDEERNGVVDKIATLCSYRPNYIKGKVNYWENNLTSKMIHQLDHIIDQKFAVVGLTF